MYFYMTLDKLLNFDLSLLGIHFLSLLISYLSTEKFVYKDRKRYFTQSLFQISGHTQYCLDAPQRDDTFKDKPEAKHTFVPGRF